MNGLVLEKDFIQQMMQFMLRFKICNDSDGKIIKFIDLIKKTWNNENFAIWKFVGTYSTGLYR